MNIDTNYIVIVIIALTAIISFLGFNNEQLFDRAKFNVGAILKQHQWDRLLSSGFLHGDMMHLMFNMFTLYFFSDIIIETLGIVEYLAIYIVSIVVGNLLSLWMYRRNPFYSAIGASGGVSGVLFASIALYPHLDLYIMFIPIPIKGFIFGIFYLVYSIYGMKSQQGNIGHAAHLGGSVIGLLSAVILAPSVLSENGLYIGIMTIPLIALAYFVLKEK